jgi:hypothetical protein
MAQPNLTSLFLPLQAGDLGIRSVQSVQFSASVASGFCALVLCKPLLAIDVANVNTNDRDMLNNLPSLPRVYDGANLQWLALNKVAAITSIYGHIDLGWG